MYNVLSRNSFWSITTSISFSPATTQEIRHQRYTTINEKKNGEENPSRLPKKIVAVHTTILQTEQPQQQGRGVGNESKIQIGNRNKGK